MTDRDARRLRVLRDAELAAQGIDSPEYAADGREATLSSLSSLFSQPQTYDFASIFHGPAGAWAKCIEPYTEASPVGVLVAYGNTLNRNPFIWVGATKHYLNENALLIGPTSTGRKGEAMNAGLLIVERADPDWASRIQAGFGSGEAVIDSIRDATNDAEGNTIDPGSEDKRLLMLEPEFAHIVSVASREGSTLSTLLRNAWDGTHPLQNRTKGKRIVATNAHVSLLAGITPAELAHSIKELQKRNGFLNRFLLVAVRRQKLLPLPPQIPRQLIHQAAQVFADAITFGRKQYQLGMDEAAGSLYSTAYVSMLSVDRPGSIEGVCSRAEPHTLRLAGLYALLDQSATIEKEHMQAALALWRYSEASAALIFEQAAWSGDADLFLGELVARDAMDRTEIHAFFHRHKDATEIDRMLSGLERMNLIEIEKVPTAGRSRERVRAKREVSEKAKKGHAS